MNTDNQSSMTFRLPADLHQAFLKACRANDRPAAQVLRDAMRGYVTANAQAVFSLDGGDKPKRKRVKP